MAVVLSTALSDEVELTVLGWPIRASRMAWITFLLVVLVSLAFLEVDLRIIILVYLVNSIFNAKFGGDRRA